MIANENKWKDEKWKQMKKGIMKTKLETNFIVDIGFSYKNILLYADE